VRQFTNKSFVLGFPFVVFLVGAIFATSFLLFIAALIWLFPLILGIDEKEE
jgi:predicted RND superfamily exporter protein